MAVGEPTAIVPDKGIRAGHNDTGTDIGARLLVVNDNGGPNSVVLSGAGAACTGVTMAIIIDTERGNVQVEGVGICTAGAAIALGAEVMATATGKVITATTGNITVGRATVRAAAADADLIEIELYPNGGVVVA